MTSATLPKTQMINLGLGYPADALLPHSVFEQASQHRFAQGDAYFLQYGDEWGDPSLRAQLADFLTRHYGVAVPPEELLISGGISGGLDIVCNMLAQPGAVAIVEDTTYFASPDIMQSHGLKVVPAPLGSGGLNLAALEALVRRWRPRLVYTIPSHHNPTGVTQSQEHREALIALAERYDFYVVADEVYHLLNYDFAAPPSYSAYVSGGRVISLGTFSKILAPGLRVGWIHARRDVLEFLVTNPTLQSAGGTNPIGASMVSSVLELGLLDQYLGSILDTFGARAAAMVQSLRAPAFAECDFRVPHGGYFVWLRLPPGMVAEQLEPRAQTYGVTFKPGNIFSVEGKYTDHIRLCFAFNDEAQIREGIARLGEAIASMRRS
ncbi:MAG: PLP-dependent aminotransferase family protein [Deinococcus sp.]|nr:PLP-dependent aminotransferase family protein [Deinococcus sp.]